MQIDSLRTNPLSDVNQQIGRLCLIIDAHFFWIFRVHGAGDQNLIPSSFVSPQMFVQEKRSPMERFTVIV